MPQKNRKITETDKAWFKLGVIEGEQRSQRTIAGLRRVTALLYNEIERLDRVYPVKNTGVFISFRRLERMREAFRRTSPSYWFVREMDKLLKKEHIEVPEHIINQED